MTTTQKPTFKQIEDLIGATTVAQIVPANQKIITIPSTSTVADAIKILSQNKISSAPVEVVEEQGHKKVFIGFVDMFDILKYVLSMYSEDHKTQVGMIHMWTQDISSLSHKGQNFATHPVTDIIGKRVLIALSSESGISKLDPFCTVAETGSLASLVYIFKKGVHRAAVADDKYNISHIVTQSNVIQFLAKNTQNFGKIGRVPIEEMNLGLHSKLLTMHSEARAINCFHQMMTNEVSACGITDQNGALVANLSISDLKGLKQENFSDLLLPVTEYLHKNGVKSHIPPVTVTPKTTFEVVVLKLAVTGLHRLWVTDDFDRPVGLISLTDVMQLLDLRMYVKEEDKDLSNK